MFQADSTALSLMAPWTHWAWASWERHQLGDTAAMAPPTDVLHLDVARGCGLGGLIATALQRAHDPRAALLRSSDSSVLAANILRRSQFMSLARDLDALNLQWCLIKGGAFTSEFPMWLPHRHMTDLDVLVEPKDLAAAMLVLKQRGYTRVGVTGPLMGSWAAASTWQRREHTLLELDLHGRLHHPPLLAGLEREVLRGRVRGDGLAWADPLASVLIAAVHRARSGYRNSAAELLDVAIWTHGWSERQWMKLWTQARTWTLELPVIALLWACVGWLNAQHIVQALAVLDPEGRYRQTGRELGEGRWHSGRDGSRVVPMAKLYTPFMLAATHAPGNRAAGAGVRVGAAFVTHALLRSTDALFGRGN